MKTETIKALLTEAGVSAEKQKDIVDKLMSENGKDVAAEQAKTQTKVAELTAANQTITDLRNTVAKYDGKDPTKLQADLDALQAKYKTDIAAEQKKAADVVKSYTLKDALAGMGVVDPDVLIYKHGGLDKFAWAGDKPVGLDDVLKSYKESTPYLFKESQPKSKAWGRSHEGGHDVSADDARAEANEAFRSLFRRE